MKRFLRELLIYSISFLLILFLTSQLFSLEKRPYIEELSNINSENKGVLQTSKESLPKPTYTYDISQNKTTSTTYLEKESQHKREELSQPSEIIYEVKVGDTMIGIAQKYGVDWKEIAKINKLKDPNYLVVGQKLIIPLRSK